MQKNHFMPNGSFFVFVRLFELQQFIQKTILDDLMYFAVFEPGAGHRIIPYLGCCVHVS